MTSSRGMIFFAVLIFLQITSLMGVFALMRLSHHMQSAEHVGWHEQMLYAAKPALDRFEEQFSPDLPCVIVPMAPTALASQSRAWWQQHGCHEETSFSSNYFVIEWLGKDACSMVQNGSKPLTIHFYRLSVIIMPKALKGAKIGLQSVVARPGADSPTCQTGAHLIRLGRQQWREL